MALIYDYDTLSNSSLSAARQENTMHSNRQIADEGKTCMNRDIDSLMSHSEVKPLRPFETGDALVHFSLHAMSIANTLHLEFPKTPSCA